MTLGPKPIHRKIANDLGQLEFDQKPNAAAQRLVWLSGMTGLTVVLLAATTALYLGKSDADTEIAAAAPTTEVATIEAEPTAAPETTTLTSTNEVCETDLRAIAHLSTIYFDEGSALLDLSALHKARQVADALKMCPGMVLQVWGHSAGSGNDATSLKISLTRAQNTISALTAMGYATQQIEVVAAGATMPAAQGDTDAALDRRVEFRIVPGL